MTLTTPAPNAESASPSWWVASTEPTDFAPLTSDLETDVVVLGAGIAGITTAYALACEGRSVLLLEAGRVAEGVSGYTTAKVSVGHNLIYADLASRFDEQTSRLYAQSQSAALEWLCTTAADLDCELERRPSVVYTEVEDDRSAVEEEVAAATAAGLRASLVTETDLPYPVVAGVRLEDQAQFHPRRYLLALVEAFRELGGRVFEQTRATDVEGTVVVTPRARVTANEVVVATHYPFLDRGLLFTRLAQYRDVVVAFSIPEASAPEVMAISNGSEEGGTHSVRTAPYREGERLLIVTGGQFKSGMTSEVEAQYDELAAWTRARFPVGDLVHRWSTQDASSVDRLPYIGQLPSSGDHVWVATGFSAWGMTGGTMAGLLLTELIQGRESQWARIYDPSRKDVRPSASKFLKENAEVAVELVKGQFRYDVPDAAALSVGEAGIFSGPDGLTAGYRDDSGALHCVSARCTHLGCTVRFNDAEKSWDCPCHGSRFGVDGEVLHGPAVDPLEPRSAGQG